MQNVGFNKYKGVYQSVLSIDRSGKQTLCRAVIVIWTESPYNLKD